MSTYHTLLKRDAAALPAYPGDDSPSVSPSVEIGVDERSAKFDLHIYSAVLFKALSESDQDHHTPVEVVDRLTLEDLKQLTQKLVNVISYYDNDFRGLKPDY
jgi:hypothetical protein